MAQPYGDNRPSVLVFIIPVVIAFAAAGAFAYYFFQYREAAQALRDKDAQFVAASGQVATLNDKIAALQNDLITLNATVAPIKSQLDLTLEQLKTANAYIDTVRNQATNSTAEVAALKTEVDKLKRIVEIKESTVVTTGLTVNQKKNTKSSVISFDADYAGYVVINATSSVPTGYAQVTCDNPYFQFNETEYKIANGSSFYVPVLPGTVGVFFGNRETFREDANGTFSVTYQY